MKLLIAGGGTGGHLFPGIAVAEELLTRKAGNEVLFVGTRRGLEARLLPELGYPVRFVSVTGLKGTGLGRRIGGFARLPTALFESARILRRFRPDLAVGVGGYASGPTILAARLCGIPTVVLEQNSVPGTTNRILGRLVDAVFVAFPDSRRFFPGHKVRVLGNPIRRQLLANFLHGNAPDNDRFNVLVLGGSQGARGLNRIAADAAQRLAGEPIRWVHQTGARDLESVQTAYAEGDPRVEVEAVPFIEDMSAAYRRADLVVGRAGATSIAELTVAKKASVLVPFPHATDDHQTLNARVLVDAGAAICCPEATLSADGLAETIHALCRDPERLGRMARAAASLGRPEAAREILDACEGLVRRRRGLAVEG